MISFPALALPAIIFDSPVVGVAVVVVEKFSVALMTGSPQSTFACLNSKFTDNLFCPW
jgi:hypothetical protein